MSSDWFNFRFGTWHLHIGRDYRFFFTWSQNPYHVQNPPEKWFEWYR